MNWRPISTAPKGPLILLSCMEHPDAGPYVCVARWIDCPHTNEIHSLHSNDGHLAQEVRTIDDLNRIASENAHWTDGYPGIVQGTNGVENWESWEFRGGILFNPTHWMPLPKGIRSRKKRA